MKYKLGDKEFDNQRDYRKALKESDERNHAHDIWSHQDESVFCKITNYNKY